MTPNGSLLLGGNLELASEPGSGEPGVANDAGWPAGAWDDPVHEQPPKGQLRRSQQTRLGSLPPGLQQRQRRSATRRRQQPACMCACVRAYVRAALRRLFHAASAPASICMPAGPHAIKGGRVRAGRASAPAAPAAPARGCTAQRAAATKVKEESGS